MPVVDERRVEPLPDEASERMGRALGPSAGRASTRRGAGEEPSGDEGELSAPA